MEYVTIDNIKPADYNPRLLTEDAKVNLKGSLSDLGFILPIIVNKTNNTIIAGHQRTKCASEIGITKFPCYYVNDKISIVDEVKFNQYHNGTEGEPNECGYLNKDIEDGFYDSVPLKFFTINGFKAMQMETIARQILKFGNVFCAIVVGRKVLLGNSYLAACRLLNIGCNISKIGAEKEALFNKWFSKQYGVFNYDKIKRKDYIQGLAQLDRSENSNYSFLYRTLILPYVKDKKSHSLLDFGCGKGFFKNLLIKNGHKQIVGVEFFNHNEKYISTSRGHKMIDSLFEHVRNNGLFDIVVCDSVINSVNSEKALTSVLDCLNIFTKMGGTIFFSGRRMEYEINNENIKVCASTRELYNFYDKDGFIAFLREGVWFFQLFLKDSDVDKICNDRGWEVIKRVKNSSGFYLQVKKTKNFSRERNVSALRYEFNLSLPNNQSYKRDDEAVEVFEKYI